MGWLLACRQAYAEGVEVLYATNTFFSESDALFDHLVCARPGARHLLLPERLASIKSLELRWEVRLWGSPLALHGDCKAHDTADNRPQLAAHLGRLCNRFPNLRSLALQCLLRREGRP
jgi:hypothetical protein